MKLKLETKDITRATTAMKLLSDPTRYKILELLFNSSASLCVYEIAESVGISHSAASHQLAKLEAHGLVEPFRDGQTVCYEVNETELVKKLRTIMSIF